MRGTGDALLAVQVLTIVRVLRVFQRHPWPTMWLPWCRWVSQNITFDPLFNHLPSKIKKNLVYISSSSSSLQGSHISGNRLGLLLVLALTIALRRNCCQQSMSFLPRARGPSTRRPYPLMTRVCSTLIPSMVRQLSRILLVFIFVCVFCYS